MSEAKVDLGRHLFYDRRISITGTFSCASCHQQARAFTDGLPVAIGATGERHARNTMTLTNVAYNPVLTWANPLLSELEQQALVPMLGEHPVEMGLTGREGTLLQTLRVDPVYQRFFPVAFPGKTEPFSLVNITRALAAFQRTLLSHNSPYDRYRYRGDLAAVSDAARRGERLFFGERLGCFHCHGGFNFSDSVRHRRLPLGEIVFHNTGLYNIGGGGNYPPDNRGVYDVTGKPEHMGAFRTPTLRNIALTAPYMHDGSLSTLSQVLDHYAAGGQTLHAGPNAGVGSANPYKSSFVRGFQLSGNERSDLVAFLESLTDETFVLNRRFASPFSEPAGVRR
jgi:cytochrome c peroxidase